LLENESVSFTVNFNPQAAGAHTGNIAINDNRGLSNIALSGDCLDPTVYTIPWTEGFEENNVNDTAIFGWMQESITGTNAWTANDTETSYNREPKSGDWNAYLRYGNTRWMFKPVQLQAGTVYRATVWARQNTAIAANATLTISYGAEASAAGMTETILAATGLVDGEYQRLGGTFTPATSGIHYLGILATITSAPWYVSIDDISIEFPEPVAPEPAIATFPLNGSTTLLNPKLQWAPSMTGEPASSFKVYMNQGGIFSEDDLVYEGEDLQYQTTGLTYGQTYYWKVLPTNAYGSDPTCPTWTFNTPGTDQLAEGFEPTTFPPLGWANGSSGNWTRSTSTPLFEGTASAYKSSSTSAVYVLSTPMLTIDSNSTIDFYTRASNVSQVLKVVYSEDRSTWTQIGEDVTYDASGIWYPVSINLSTLNGSDYYIGFQTPTQTSSGSIYVDHVIGPNITPLAPDAPTLSAPSDAAPNQSPNPKLTWTAATTGGIPTGYNIYLDTNAEPTTLIGSSTTTSYDVNTALNWGDTYYWKVEATNATGTSNASTVRSFTVMSDPTIYDLPYLVDFGTSTSQAFPPTSWTQLGGFYPTTTGTSSQWGRGNWLNGATGNNAAKINIWGTDRNGWLITPPIAIPADGHELRFDLGLTKWNNSIPIEDNTAQEDDRFMVLVSDSANMSNATILQEWNNSGSEYVFNSIPHTGTSVIIDLTGHTGDKYFAFYGESTITGNGDNDLFVDNVMVRETPIGRPDPVTLVSPADEATYLPVEGFTLNWTPAITGGTPSSYKVYLDTNPDPSTLIATETEPSHEIVTPLAYGSTYYWKVIAHNSSGDADASTIFSFETVPEGLVVLGDGTANNSLPVNAFYGYTYSQTIYPQTSINLADQRIEKISYYWNGAGVGTNTGGWTVYMGHTSATEFASTTDWIPLTELTQVFTGNVPIPATAGWIEIPLQTPFLYNNTDNLVIAVDENTSGYDASGCYFYTTGTGTNSVSIRYQSDSTNPDPATPPTGTLVSAYPNIRMQLGDIPTGPPDHVTLLSPENDVTGVLPEDVVLSWASSLSGGIATYYEIYVGEDPIDPGNDYYGEYLYESTGTNFDLSAQTDIDLGYSSRWYWAVLPFNAGSESPDPTDPEFMVWNFTTIEDPAIVSLPHEENFDDVTAPALPYGWTGYIGSTNTSAYVRTTTSYPVSQPNSVYLTNSSDATADLRLITPDITVPMNSIKLSFSARGGSTGYNLRVGTVDALDETGTFTQLASIDLTASHETYSVSFAGYAGTDQNICFKHGLGGTYRSIYIDDVTMDELVPNDLAVVSLTGRDYGFQNTDVTHTVTVKNNGTSSQNSYTVYLKSVDGRIVLASETINEELLPEATKAIEFTWAPSALGALEIYGEVVLAGDVVPVNNVSDIMAFNTYQEGILMEGFEAGVIPANWTVINADGGTQVWNAQTANPHTGSYSARVRYETSSLDNDDWLITPPLQVTSSTTDEISFWMRTYSATSDDAWQVLISTTDTNPASFTMIDEGTGQLAEYVQKSYNLDSYGNAVVYLAVRYMGAFDWYLYVDDFVGPPIYTPESLTQPVVTISKTGSNVVLDWNLIPYATNYQIHAADAPEGPYTLVTTVTGNTYSTSATGKKFFKVIASTGISRTISQRPLSLEQQLLKDEADRAAHGKN
ncbi:MAG: choice-of-anchor J domain-containing protein, partial [Candidatus Cloacimonetes bacterium]|nr:choice-of-anchor J domain-containing protein [Candidatus Cloacimonadota bacterium]MDY0173318.1 choice-of-anchor J domain-containing protein [Candidatus Cloacimonadaceae bacterium]